MRYSQAARCKRTGSDESWHETGVEIGRMLSELLEYVIDNPEKNDKKILCNYVKKKISQRNKTV